MVVSYNDNNDDDDDDDDDPFFRPAFLSVASFFKTTIWIGEKELYYPDGFSGSNILHISSL